jgi:CIC family chloride channel protein
MNLIKQLYQFVILFIRTRLTRVQYIMIIAVLVGFTSGLTAVLLKTLVHYLQHWIQGIGLSRFAYLLFPVVGLIVTLLLVNFFFKGYVEKGIPMVLKAIAGKSSFIPFRHTYQHVATSSVTVGLGGSVGLEAPIVATGSAIGSNIARISDLNYRERTLLIGCGASAGIAAVFNAPIAGVIFAIEVLLTDVVIVSYFIPLIISSVVGALCSRIILQESFLFNFTLKETFDYRNVPFYIILGALSGFVALYYARAFKRTEMRLHNWKINVYLKAVAGGALLLGLYFFFPPLFGEGYESIKLVGSSATQNPNNENPLFSLLQEDWSLVVFTGCIVLLKPLAAAITLGSGGNGGNFAPSLFTGAFLGFFFSKLLNTLNWVRIPEGNFSLVGMAGVLSGVMYCPLSAIFLIAEVTNGYELFIPLMIVSSIAFFIVKSYEPYSMDTKRLAMEGQIFTHKKEKNILTSIKPEEMVQADYDIIGIDKTLRDLIALIQKSDKNIFAVCDNKERFVGIIELNDVKMHLFEAEQFDSTTIRVLVKKPAAILSTDNSMHEVMEKFDMTHSWHLPVLDEQKKFIGFISKTKLFDKYREILSSQIDLYE